MNTAWDILRELDEMRHDFNRVFQGEGLEDFFTPMSRVSFLPGRSARTYPLLNLSEDEHNVYVDALAPGLDIESLNVNVVNSQLNIMGEKAGLAEKIEADAYHRNERAAGRFVRAISLLVEVVGDKAKADYKDGILSITLPKAEEAKPKQITVNIE